MICNNYLDFDILHPFDIFPSLITWPINDDYQLKIAIYTTNKL